MDALLLRGGVVVLAIGLVSWAVLGFTIVAGRLVYDLRWRELEGATALRARRARRLISRAGRRPRTEWGKWRRVAAVVRLARAHHPAARRLVRVLLADPDDRIASAAVRALGHIGDDWAIDILVQALRQGVGPRSRVAAELDGLQPAPGPRLPALLRDWNPTVRFWGAKLLAHYPELGNSGLIALTWDPDPNVRAAAVETLGGRKGAAVATAVTSLLDDPAWFVRVHAARSAGHVAGASAAPTISRLLADGRWWVRTAAKDALREIGPGAVPTLLSVLGHSDAFARNGAAEVLQDIGFVDSLALEDPRSPLLARIYAAGGDGLREAAERRTASVPARRRIRAA